MFEQSQCCHRFLTVRYVKQAHDLRNVVANGEVGQSELATDLLVRKTRCQQIENLLLPWGQLAAPFGRTAPTADLRHCSRSVNERDIKSMSIGQHSSDFGKSRAQGVQKAHISALHRQFQGDLTRWYFCPRHRYGLEAALLRATPAQPMWSMLDVSERSSESGFPYIHAANVNPAQRSSYA